MSRAADNDNAPWYRHLWVWLIMIPPAASVVAGFITAWLAGGPPALVVDDYGEIALATEQRQNRDQLARELGLHAELSLIAEPGAPATVSLDIGALQAGFRPPQQLQLQLIHPTQEEQDQTAILQRTAAGYSGALQLPAGRAYVQLEDLDGQWRLVGELPAGATKLQLTAGGPP